MLDRWIRLAGLLVAIGAIAVALAGRVPASSSSTAAPQRERVEEEPGMANLDPALRRALRRAGAAARDAGVALAVESGWRSPEHQARLLREAIATYGSAAEAARWVATPETSPHVSGAAVDVTSAAAAWLAVHGAPYGLCQVYANEPWHYELRPEAVAHGCPAPYADPTHDPRMQPRG